MDRFDSSHVLVVVDMQADFVVGSLGSDAAKAIVPKVVELMDAFEPCRIVLTRDTHHEDYLKTLEGRMLPVEHCVEGTPGHDVVEDVMLAFLRNSCEDVAQIGDAMQVCARVVDKSSFGSLRLPTVMDVYRDGVIHVCGLCTDICVVSNALILRAAFPNTPIVCHADCCAGTSREAHEAALTVMRSCQIDVAGEEAA